MSASKLSISAMASQHSLSQAGAHAFEHGYGHSVTEDGGGGGGGGAGGGGGGGGGGGNAGVTVASVGDSGTISIDNGGDALGVQQVAVQSGAQSEEQGNGQLATLTDCSGEGTKESPKEADGGVGGGARGGAGGGDGGTGEWQHSELQVGAHSEAQDSGHIGTRGIAGEGGAGTGTYGGTGGGASGSAVAAQQL